MTRVRLLVPLSDHKPGDEVELSPEKATALIQAAYAKRVKVKDK